MAISSYALAAKNIRKDLKQSFPGVKFSVTSKGYSMGCSISINYTNGPTQKQVESVAYKYQRGTFDGMTDSYSYKRGFDESTGSADYVSVTRRYTADVLQDVLKEIDFKDADAVIHTNSYGSSIETSNCDHRHHYYKHLENLSF